MKPHVLLPAFVILLALSACVAPPVSPTPGPAPVSPAVIAPSSSPSTVPASTSGVSPTPTAAGPRYQDAELSVQERVDDLLQRMTLEEKIGQMTQVEKGYLHPGDIGKRYLGSVLNGGGGAVSPNRVENWKKMVDGYQREALATRLGIPLIYGADAVHGLGGLQGATVFPHNIGLGATRDPDLVRRIGRATAEEMIAAGIRWNFAPVVAVPQDIRWGRTYEGYSEDTTLVTQLSSAYLRGLQEPHDGAGLSDPLAVLATPKHFIGDGGTRWGTSKTENYQIDQGDTRVDEQTLRRLYLPPYQAAIDSGAKAVMVSFSSWNGTKMHAQRYLIGDVLKGELRFSGFVVSDWAGINQVAPSYDEAIITGINAGVDLVMVPDRYSEFIDGLSRAVQSGRVPLSRVDDAVRRILTVKFELGLFEHPYADAAEPSIVRSEAHLALAREAVQKSLVLLKNADHTLPLNREAARVLVAGPAADDIGIQIGGWGLTWQGQPGNVDPGTTILDGIRASASPATRVDYDARGAFEAQRDASGNPLLADAGIAVVGEAPYAEGQGDRADLSLTSDDLRVIERLRAQSKRLIVVLVSGRPLIVTGQLPSWDALVAAWLPGTEGAGVADGLFGKTGFSGKLPFTWPRWNSQLPSNVNSPRQEGCDGPLFPFGYGLSSGDPGLKQLDCPAR